MNTNKALQSTVRIALSMLLFILIAFYFYVGDTSTGDAAYAAASVSTGKVAQASESNTYIYSDDPNSSLASLYKKTNEGSTVCSFTSTPSWVGESAGSFSYLRNNGGTVTETSCSSTYGSVIYQESHFSLVDETLLITDDPGEISFTFGVGEELRKALKDKMLLVTVTPYVMTHTTDTINNNLSGVLKEQESADISLLMHEVYTDKQGVTHTENVRLSTKTYVGIPVKDQFIVGAQSSSLNPSTYSTDSYFQVTLANWEQSGTFAVAIKEVGIRVSVTFNTDLVIKTGNDNKPSTDPAQIGQVTTCIVEGAGRYATAPSDYAKGGDILNVNLVLQKNSEILQLDTKNYVDSENNYSMDLNDIALADVKDGTVFRYFFRRTNDYLIDWEIAAGAVDEGATELASNNKSGQTVRFVASSGEPESNEQYAGQLVLRPIITYNDRATDESFAINGQRPINIVINIDSSAPNTPWLDEGDNFYHTYLDEDYSTYYTEVQASVAQVDKDSVNNLIRLKITDSAKPEFTSEALDLMGGSNMIIYYKTSYIGDAVPTTTAAKNSTSFNGPSYIEETAGSGVYVAYEGRLEEAPRTVYKMINADLLAGTAISASPAYYVRNNVGKYVRTEDSFAQKGVTYYRLSQYDYATKGEYTGIYARVDAQKVVYGDIYLNLVTTSGTLKAGVWAIEFLAYDYVGKSTLCDVKKFIKADITDYQFSLQFYLGNEATNELDIQSFIVDIRTVSTAGVVSSESVEIESDTSGQEKIDFVRLRRANKLLISVSFESKDDYESYKLIELAAGNTSIVVKDNVYSNYGTTIYYTSFTPYGTTRVVNYTMEIDASFCSDPNNRIFRFRFKNIVTVNPTGKAPVDKIYTGSSLGISDNVNVPAYPQLRGIVKIMYYYYTGDSNLQNSVFDGNEVRVGNNGSNIPVEAGQYVYYAEIADHTLYYGLSIGRLNILAASPNVDTACEDLRINYREKRTINGVEKSGLAILDFDPEDRDWLGRQQPASGLTATIVYEGRTYFLSTMSSDKIPGYYRIISPSATSTSYLNPTAGELELTIQFIPVKVEQAVSGTSVQYAYDENGNFQRDTNYEIKTFTRRLTVVHDENVLFNVSDEQDNGTVKTTTMVAVGAVKQLKYVVFTFNTLPRTIAYTITAGEETDSAGKLIDLKRYALVTYSPASSLTLSIQQLNALTFTEAAPTKAGIYAVRVKLNEGASGCNYSTTQYAYIQIDKIMLDVDVESYTGDYQYEEYPAVTLLRNNSVFSQTGISQLKYDFYYYQYDKKTAEERTADEYAVKQSDLRRYKNTPLKAGEYYVRVTVIDDNYQGVGYAKYTIRRVSTSNGYFTPDWPRINSNPLDFQSHITAGQPLSEVLLDTGKRFVYAYREVSASGTTSFSSREVLGSTYIVYQQYDEWYDTYIKGQIADVMENVYYDTVTGLINDTFDLYGQYTPVLRELYNLFVVYLQGEIETAIQDGEEEREQLLTSYLEMLNEEATNAGFTDSDRKKSAAFVRFYRRISDEELTVNAFLERLYEQLSLNGETDALAAVGLTNSCTPAMAANIETVIDKYYYVNADYKLLEYVTDIVLIQGMKYIQVDVGDSAFANAQKAEILLKLHEQTAAGYAFAAENHSALVELLDAAFAIVGASEHECRLLYLTDMQTYEPSYKETAYVFYYCFFAYTKEGNVITFEDNFDFIYEPVEVYVGKAYVDWNEVEIEDKTYSGRVNWEESAIDLGLTDTDFVDNYNEIILALQLKVGADYLAEIEKRIMEFTNDYRFYSGIPMVIVKETVSSGGTTYDVGLSLDGININVFIRSGLTQTQFESDMRSFSAWTSYLAVGASNKETITVGGNTITTYKGISGSDAFTRAARAIVAVSLVWQEEYEVWWANGYTWDMPRENTKYCSDELNDLIDDLSDKLPTYATHSPDVCFDFLFADVGLEKWIQAYDDHYYDVQAYLQAVYLVLYDLFAEELGESTLLSEGFYSGMEMTETDVVCDLLEFAYSENGYSYAFGLNDYRKQDTAIAYEKRTELVTSYGADYVLYCTRLNNRYAFYLKKGTSEYPLYTDMTYDQACANIVFFGQEYADEFVDSTFVTQQLSPRQMATETYELTEGTALRKMVAFCLFITEYEGSRAVRLAMKPLLEENPTMRADDFGTFLSVGDIFSSIPENGQLYEESYDFLAAKQTAETTQYVNAFDDLYLSLSDVTHRKFYTELYYDRFLRGERTREASDYFTLYELVSNFDPDLFLAVADAQNGYHIDQLVSLMSIASKTNDDYGNTKLIVTKTGTTYSVKLQDNVLGEVAMYNGLSLRQTTDAFTTFGGSHLEAFNRTGLSTKTVAQGASISVEVPVYANTALSKSITLIKEVYDASVASKGAKMLEFKAKFCNEIARAFSLSLGDVLCGSIGVTNKELLEHFLRQDNSSWYTTFTESVNAEKAVAGSYYPYYCYLLQQTGPEDKRLYLTQLFLSKGYETDIVIEKDTSATYGLNVVSDYIAMNKVIHVLMDVGNDRHLYVSKTLGVLYSTKGAIPTDGSEYYIRNKTQVYRYLTDGYCYLLSETEPTITGASATQINLVAFFANDDFRTNYMSARVFTVTKRQITIHVDASDLRDYTNAKEVKDNMGNVIGYVPTDYTVYGVYDEDLLYNAMTAEDGSKFYPITYGEELIDADSDRTTRFRGTFSYEKNGEVFTEAVAAGTYTVTYTLEDNDYFGECVFTLTIVKSDLEVATVPQAVASNLVYHAVMKDASSFYGGAMRAASGEELGITRGTYTLSKYDVKVGDTYQAGELTDETVFPAAGTVLRLYFNYIPRDTDNYNAFTGTLDNKGYVIVTVGQADVSSRMSVSTVETSYTYKQIRYTDEAIRGIIEYSITDTATEDLSGLQYTISLRSSRDVTPPANEYLSADTYTLTITIEDDNYCGSTFCLLVVNKKAAYVNVIPSATGTIVTKNGVFGTKKAYKGGSQTLDVEVREYDTDTLINEGTSVVYKQNNVNVSGTPSEIGYYDAYVSLPNSVNYYLVNGSTGAEITALRSFLIISFNLTGVELTNLDQIYTVPKTITVFQGINKAVYSFSYVGEDGTTYKELPGNAGTYYVYLNFAAEDNNGYEDTISALDITDEAGRSRGYKLVIDRYPAEITAPGTVNATYTGKEGEKFSPYTSPYGMTLQYTYRVHGTDDEFLPTTAKALGAFDAGEYDVRLEIDNRNYRGNTIIIYNVAQARLTERSTPVFAPYAYNDTVEPEYLGEGAFSFGSIAVDGRFYIELSTINTLSVGEYTVTYTFEPTSSNYRVSTGTTKLKIVKRQLAPETLYIGQNGDLLTTQSYSVEYNNATQPLSVKFDRSVIYGYPKTNSDFTVNVKYVLNGSAQTPLSLGAYTVIAEVLSKNYSCQREWEYKYVITKATPVIMDLPFVTREVYLGETVDSSLISGGRAVLNMTRREQIYGTFSVDGVRLTRANEFPLPVTFTPGDQSLYNTVHFTMPVSVIGYDTLFIGEQKNTELGETASGTDWTDQLITFSTNVRFNTRGITVPEGEHGAAVEIVPKSGEQLEYGAALRDFSLRFVCAEDDCADCQQVVDRLNTYGVLSFADELDYVPHVGESISVVYKVIVDLIQDASQFNDMYGVISIDDILVPKRLTTSNASIEVFLFDDMDGILTKNVFVSVSSGETNRFTIELDSEGYILMDGAIRPVDFDIERVGDNVILSVMTNDYVISDQTVAIELYKKIDEEDIEVSNLERSYNGRALTLEDLGIVIHNTQLSVSADAITMKIYDNENALSTGKEVGDYTIVLVINDRVNKYYGDKIVTFTVLRRDVSSDVSILLKEEDSTTGETWYMDSYGTTTYLTIVAGVDGTALEEGDYEVYAKRAENSDGTYARITSFSAGEYTLRLVVDSEGYYGERYFNYRVLPQEITMYSGVSSPYVVEYGSNEYLTFSNSVLQLSYRDPNGYAFNFDDFGGVTVYYSGTGYPKQSNVPTNAGTYSVSVESNSANYTVKDGTLTYTIRPRKITITGTPTIVSVDDSGAHLIYGYKLSDFTWLMAGVEVLDASGNEVSGNFTLSASDASRVPYAGEQTVTLIFIPDGKNYDTATVNVQVVVAKKVIRLEFDNLTASYDGTNKRGELSYKEVEDGVEILFGFVNGYGQTVEPVTAGLYTITATTTNNNYTIDLSKNVLGEVQTNPTFTVYKAVVNKDKIVAPKGEEIGVGESLAKSALSGGKAYYKGFTEPIGGSFSYVEGGRAFSAAGTVTVEYRFTPNDSANFATYTGTIEISIGRGKATVTAGTNEFEYGTPADFSLLSFETLPAGLQGSIKYDLTYNGKTYRSGDVIPAGTYYFTCYVDDVNYVSDPVLFRYLVEKKEIDVDFINASGEVVTVYSTPYGEEPFIDVRMYNSNVSDKRTYLMQDEETIGKNVEYRYVSRTGTKAYDSAVRPKDIGSYDLTVTLRHENYVATHTIIYRVTTGTVSSITFDETTLVQQMYGAVVAPIVNTTPANVGYYIIYQGHEKTLPTEVGTYTITVYIDDDNFASKQVSATFRINPKPLSITDIHVKDKAYDGVATVEITGRTEGVLFGDEVFLEMTAETFNKDANVGDHYVTITSCVLKGLHSGNYDLEYPTYDGKVRIYNNLISAKTGSSYMISNEGFAAGTELAVYRVNTEKNQTSVWSRMLGVEASVYAYSISVNNASGTNTTQYKICMEIPEEYRNKDFKVEFDGALAGQTITYDVEGNYISFYSTSTDGQVVFSNAKFKYTYVIIAAVLIIIAIAVLVLFILNPLQSRRSVSNPGAIRSAVHRIRRGY